MIRLHCSDRGHTPPRPTDGVDTVIEVRALPQTILIFTQTLVEVGSAPLDVSGEGTQHLRLGLWIHRVGAAPSDVSPSVRSRTDPRWTHWEDPIEGDLRASAHDGFLESSWTLEDYRFRGIHCPSAHEWPREFTTRTRLEDLHVEVFVPRATDEDPEAGKWLPANNLSEIGRASSQRN